MNIEVISVRAYGEAKLIKPKNLKGVKSQFSVDYIQGKCACKCYVLDCDVYIMHRDFNSTVLYDNNHEFRRKFVYKDAFGAVVLRGEAWLVIRDAMINTELPHYAAWRLAEQLTGDIGACEWERFLEEVLRKCKYLTI